MTCWLKAAAVEWLRGIVAGSLRGLAAGWLPVMAAAPSAPAPGRILDRPGRSGRRCRTAKRLRSGPVRPPPEADPPAPALPLS